MSTAGNTHEGMRGKTGRLLLMVTALNGPQEARHGLLSICYRARIETHPLACFHSPASPIPAIAQTLLMIVTALGVWASVGVTILTSCGTSWTSALTN